MESDVTVVTACDHNFVWGAALLGWSMRFYNMKCQYNVLGYDLPIKDVQVLESIPGTKVIQTHKPNSRSVCTQKPMAISTANTEIIVWMDADCIVSGNLKDFFVCPDGKLQIRFRGKEETATIYRNFYAANDEVGHIPHKVLEIWQKDIQDLKRSQINTVCQTNCFVLNRSHLGFIESWQKQMEKVIPHHTKGVYAKDSVAYSMTDESVINSLFAFSSQAPETAEYMMDKDPFASCVHFGLNPKPWQHWTRETFTVYQTIMNLIRWADESGFLQPNLPYSFKPEHKNIEFRRACLSGLYRDIRYKVSTELRKTLRSFR